jgi:hypothetical protein
MDNSSCPYPPAFAMRRQVTGEWGTDARPYQRDQCRGSHPDGRHVVSGSCGNTLRVWDLATGESQKALFVKLVHRVISRRHTAVGHGPKGWLEKGPSSSLFVRYVSHRICSSLTPRIQTLLKPTVCLLLMTRCTISRGVPSDEMQDLDLTSSYLLSVGGKQTIQH